MTEAERAQLARALMMSQGQGEQDPMRVINARFKPFEKRQPEMRAGTASAGDRARTGVADALRDYTGNTIADRLGNAAGAVMDYGPLPAQLATAIAMQPVRAGEAVGEALNDPSLGNVTNAGAQTAMALFQPSKALGALGAGYGVAASRDLGLFGGAAEAAGLSADQQKRKGELEKRIGAQNWKSGAERRSIEDELAKLRQVEVDASREENSARIRQKEKADAASQEEYNRAVMTAEGARDAELKRKRRFSETEIGKVYNQTGGAPALAMGLAGGFGVLDRLAKGAPKSAGDYARLGFEGFAGASLGNNVGLMYDALATDADNPDRAAMAAYASKLPDGHPQKARATEQLADTRGLPEINPVRSSASNELYDPVKFAERLGMSLLEGVPMAWTGANIPGAINAIGRGAKGAASNTASTLGELPGDMATGFFRGMGRASSAKADAAELRAGADAIRRVSSDPGTRTGAALANEAMPSALPAGPLPRAAASTNRPDPTSAPPVANTDLTVPPARGGGNQIALTQSMFDDLKPNATYGANHSRQLQDYTIKAAERGIDPASKGKGGFNRAEAAREIEATPTMVKNATDNMLRLASSLGIDARDPKMLMLLADALNKSPAKARGGNVYWSAAPAAALAGGMSGEDDPMALARALLTGGR